MVRDCFLRLALETDNSSSSVPPKIRSRPVVAVFPLFLSLVFLIIFSYLFYSSPPPPRARMLNTYHFPTGYSKLDPV